MTAVSGGDLLPALFLLVPGYVTLLLARRIVGVRESGSPIEWTLGSLALSGVIGAVFVGVHGLHSADSFVEHFFAHPLRSVLEIVLLAVLVAFILAFALIGDFVTRLAHRVFFGNRSKPLNLETWDVFMAGAFAKWVQVRTTTGEELKGILVSNSTREEGKALRLAQPIHVAYAEDGELLGESPLGEELILLESTIDRVVLLSHEQMELQEPEPPSGAWPRVRWALLGR